jgi:hypothetical protein
VSTRDRVVYCAVTLLGDYGKGSPEVFAIWRDVLPPEWTDAQVRQYAATKEWCGGFALHALRLGGATQEHWHDGIGFIGPLKLRPMPEGSQPRAGDIAVKEHPFAHHMVVEYWNHEKDWGDLAGNTPTAARHHHASSDGVTFYSIEPLVAIADAAPPPEAA